MPYKDKNKQKDAVKRSYLRNKVTHAAKSRKLKQKRKEFVHRYKRLPCVKCVECGEGRWQCLEFHHTNPNEKYTDLAKLTKSGASLDKIKAEIRKCVVICANCHRVLHNGGKWEQSSLKTTLKS